MNRRQIVNVLSLAAGICLLYLVFSVFSVIITPSSHQHVDSDNVDSDLLVNVKSVKPGADGKLELTLSLNVEDLVRHMEGHKVKNTNGEATSNAVPRNTSFVMNVPNLCTETPGLQYIVYVHTSPGNEQRRANIRKTWGDVELFRDGRMRVVFMAGIPENESEQDILQKEQNLYTDIVQGDFLDIYHNLTLKALMGLQWVSEFCPQAQYAIKTDDDAFINIFSLLGTINDNRRKKRMLMCPLWGTTMPILRDPAKCMKWCVKYTEFPGLKYFPSYCAGLTYVFSTDIVPQMYKVSRTTPFFWIDDVYVTGILPPKIGGMSYVNIMKSFTLKEKDVVEDYLKTNAKEGNPPRYMVAHIKNEKIWMDLWQMSLKRTTDDQLMSLSTHIVHQHSFLLLRWTKLSKPK